MTRGRRPLPTALKVARGNPGKRKLNLDEPQPLPGAAMPGFLSPEARKYWPDLAYQLEEAGVLTRVDGIALALLCEAFATWRTASRRAQRNPTVTSRKSGMVRRSPYYTVMNEAQSQVLGLLREFGMSPASRTRVTRIKPINAGNKFAAIKAGKGNPK